MFVRGELWSSNDWEGQEVLGPVEVDTLDGEPVRDGTDGREKRALEAGEGCWLALVHFRRLQLRL